MFAIIKILNLFFARAKLKISLFILFTLIAMILEIFSIGMIFPVFSTLLSNEPLNINFMNIDVEGADLEVMHSSNWTKYRPRVLVVEDGRFEIFNPNASKLFSFCQEVGYKIYAKLVNSLVFVEENFLIH